ncbi:hypothetical protein OEA41_005670 [Lepraria neglecta]|uniref:Probable transporter MCH1 n=1 Tax=Lepraria neglecta TaxID=209136 RepID=A0AAD9Z677_9LECA|nr:hypothetical protein OEA41_005670 [Lepraria neglecta]
MLSRSSSQSVNPKGGIDKLDFDSNRKPSSALHDSFHSSASEPSGLLRDDESFFSNIVDGVIERDRRKMRRHVIKYASFVSAILSCLCAGSITAYSLYGPLFLKHIKYTQYQVNAVSTTAELAMYLPVPLFGYLCDRYNPRPLSLAASIMFGLGYLLAALTYHAGPPKSEGGWPFAIMVIAFIGVGSGTACMYLSAVTTCAKNFGKGKHKGLALAMPIAAFGLSGMWQSQVGSHFFSERDENGEKGDVDVFRYFIFLAGLLFAVGLIGALGLRVTDEEELIDEAVDELERSGLLEDSPFFQPTLLHDGENTNGYGTLSPPARSTSSLHGSKPYDRPTTSDSAIRKTLILNTETRLFLTDPRMWFFAAGFFLTTGPGEAFINNLGTIIHTLYPPPSPGPTSLNSPATHVSIVALTSTIARLVTGTLSDLLAPSTDRESKRSCTLSRMVFLLASTLLFSLGQVLLASGAVQRTPTLFPAVSALVGLGYGAIFSLSPIIVSVVWGVQNFGTNWGIVAVVPAAGAAIWGAIYSAVYQAGVDTSHLRLDGEEEQMCYGLRCYQGTFWAMAVSSWVAVALWVWVWRGWRRKGIAV